MNKQQILSEQKLVLSIPNEQLLELMVEEEEKIRTSEYYRNECTKVKDIPNGWLNITNDIQRKIVKKFGFVDNISCDIACNMLRRAHILFPNNDKFKKIPLQVRNNKSKNGNLSIGDSIPNIQLYNLDYSEIELYNLLDHSRPTIIFAGSQT